MLDEHAAADPLDTLRPVTDARAVQAVIEAVRRVHVGPEVRQYCVDLVGATRRLPELRLGASPRATLQLVRAARAQAALRRARVRRARRRAAVAVPVLAHRLLLTPDAQAGRAARPSTVVRAVLAGARLPVPAPRPGPRAADAAWRPAVVRRSPRAGRCLLAGGVATAACSVPLDERDLLRIGAFVALLPLLGRCCSPPAPGGGAGARGSSRRRGCPSAATATVDAAGARHRALVGPLRAGGHRARRRGPQATAPPRFTVHRALRPRRRRPSPTAAAGAARGAPHRPARRRAPPTRSASPSSSARSPRHGPAARRCPGSSRCTGCPPALGAGEGTHGRGARPPGPGQLGRPGAALPPRRRAAAGALAQHGPARRADGPAGGAAVAGGRRPCCSTGATAPTAAAAPTSSLEWAVSFAASVCAHLIGRGEPVDLVTEDGDACRARAAGARPDARRARRAAPLGPRRPRRPGAAGPATSSPCSAPSRRATGRTSRRATRKGGYAVLLDTATWDPADGRPGSADAAASALRNAGWTVAVAAAGTHPRPGLGARCEAPYRGRRRPERADRHARSRARRSARSSRAATWLGDAALAAAVRRGARAGAAPPRPAGRRRWASAVGPARAARRPLRGHARLPGPAAFARFAAWSPGRARRSPPASRRCPRPRRSCSWSRSPSGRCWSRCTARPCWPAPRPRRACRCSRSSPCPPRSTTPCSPGGGRAARRRASACCSCCATGPAASGRAGSRWSRSRWWRRAGGRRSGHVRRHRGPLRRRRARAASGAIGLSPFTALRGQLTQERPTELFEVRGLPQPAYLRALTLSTYVPDVGWQATRPGPGPKLPGHARRGRGRGRADRHRRRPERRASRTTGSRSTGSRSRSRGCPAGGPTTSAAAPPTPRGPAPRTAGSRRPTSPRPPRASCATRGAAPVPWRPTSTPRGRPRGWPTSPPR